MQAYKEYMFKFIKFLNSAKTESELRSEVDKLVRIEAEFANVRSSHKSIPFTIHSHKLTIIRILIKPFFLRVI
jgi:hypothetical protein